MRIETSLNSSEEGIQYIFFQMNKNKVFLCECDLWIDKLKLPPIGSVYFSWTKGSKFIKSSKFQTSGSTQSCKQKLSLNLKLYRNKNKVEEKKTRFSLYSSKDVELWSTLFDVSCWTENAEKFKFEIKSKNIESGNVQLKLSKKQILELDQFHRNEAEIEESFEHVSEKASSNSQKNGEHVYMVRKQLEDANLLIEKLRNDRTSYLRRNQQLQAENKKIKKNMLQKMNSLEEYYESKVQIRESVYSQEIQDLIGKFVQDEKCKYQIISILIEQLNQMEEKYKVEKHQEMITSKNIMKQLETEQLELRQENFHYESELKELKEKQFQQEKELEIVKNQLDQVIESFQVQKEQLIKKTIIQEQKTKDYEFEIIRLRSLLAKETEENDIVKNQAKSLEDVVKEKSTKIEEIYTKNENLTSDLHTLKGQQEKLNREISYLEFEISEIKKIRESLDKQLKNERIQRNKEIQLHLETQDEKDYEHNRELENFQRQIAQKEGQIMTLNFQLKEKSDQILILTENEEYLRKNFNMIEEQLKRSINENTAFQKKNLQLIADNDRINKFLEEVEIRNHQLEDQNQKLRIDVEVFRDKVKILEEDIKILNNQFLGQINKKDAFLEEEIEDLQKIKGDYDDAWNKHIQETQKERKDFAEELQNQKQNKRQIMNHTEDLQKKIAEQIGQITNIQNSVNIFAQILEKDEISPDEMIKLIFLGPGSKEESAPVSFLQTFLNKSGPNKEKSEESTAMPMENLFSAFTKKEQKSHLSSQSHQISAKKEKNEQVSPSKDLTQFLLPPKQEPKQQQQKKQESKNRNEEKKQAPSLFGFLPFPSQPTEKKQIKNQEIVQKAEKQNFFIPNTSKETKLETIPQKEVQFIPKREVDFFPKKQEVKPKKKLRQQIPKELNLSLNPPKMPENNSLIQKLKNQIFQAIMKTNESKKQNKKLQQLLQTKKEESEQLRKVIDQYGAQIDELDKLILRFKSEAEQAGRKVKDFKKMFEKKLEKSEQSELNEIESMFGKASQLCETIQINFQAQESDFEEEKELMEVLKYNEAIKQNSEEMEPFKAQEKRQSEKKIKEMKEKKEKKGKDKKQKNFGRSRFRKEKVESQVQVYIEDPKFSQMKEQMTNLKMTLNSKEGVFIPQEKVQPPKQEDKRVVKLKIFDLEKQVAICKSQLEDKIQYIEKIQKQNEWLSQHLIQSKKQEASSKCAYENEKRKIVTENRNLQKDLFQSKRKNQELVSRNLRLENQNDKLKIQVPNKSHKVEREKVKEKEKEDQSEKSEINKILKNQLEKATFEINDMKKEKSRLEKEKRQVEQKYEIIQRNKFELQKKIIIQQSKACDIENELVIEKRKRKRFESQQEDKEYQLEKYKKMQVQIQTYDPFMSADFQKLQAEKARFFAESLDKEEIIHKKQMQIQKLQKTLTQYKNKIYSFESCEKKKNSQILDDVIKLETELRQAQSMIESLNEENDNLRENLEMMKEEIEKQDKTQYQTEQNEYREYEEKLALYTDELLKIQHILDEKLLIIEDLNNDNLRMQNEMVEADEKLKEYTEYHEQLQNKLVEKKQQNKQLQIKLHQYQCDALETITQMKNKSKKLQTDFRKIKQNNNEIQEQNKMLMIEISKFKQKLQKADDQLLRHENDVLKKQRIDLQNEYHQYKSFFKYNIQQVEEIVKKSKELSDEERSSQIDLVLIQFQKEKKEIVEKYQEYIKNKEKQNEKIEKQLIKRNKQIEILTKNFQITKENILLEKEKEFNHKLDKINENFQKKIKNQEEKMQKIQLQNESLKENQAFLNLKYTGEKDHSKTLEEQLNFQLKKREQLESQMRELKKMRNSNIEKNVNTIEDLKAAFEQIEGQNKRLKSNEEQLREEYELQIEFLKSEMQKSEDAFMKSYTELEQKYKKIIFHQTEDLLKVKTELNELTNEKTQQIYIKKELNQSLLLKIKESERKLQRYMKENCQLKEKLKQKQKNEVFMSEKLKGMNTELKQEKIKRIKTEKTFFNLRESEVKNSDNDQKEQISSLKKIIHSLKTDISELQYKTQKTVKEYKFQNEHYEKKNKQLQQKIEIMNQKNKNISEEWEKINKKYQQMKKKNQELNVKNQGLSLQGDSLKCELKTVKQLYKKLQHEIQKRKNKITQDLSEKNLWQKEIEDKKMEIQQVQEKNYFLEGEKQSLEGKLKEKMKIIISLNQKNEKLASNLLKEQHSLQKLKQKLWQKEKVSEEMNKVKVKNEKLQQNLMISAKELEILKEEKVSLEKEFYQEEFKKEEYENVKKINFQLNKKLENYSRELSDFRRSFSDIKISLQRREQALKISLTKFIRQYAPQLKEKLDKILLENLDKAI